MCLCFSPVGPQFAKRAQQFPGLINGTTIDWFLPWPEEALISVADKFLADFPMVCTDEVGASLEWPSLHAHNAAALGASVACDLPRGAVCVGGVAMRGFLWQLARTACIWPVLCLQACCTCHVFQQLTVMRGAQSSRAGSVLSHKLNSGRSCMTSKP